MEINKTVLMAEKRVFDAFEVPYLDHKDKRIVQYVIKSLKGTGAKMSFGEPVQFAPLVKEALSDFGDVFGAEVAARTESLLTDLPIKQVLSEPHLFSVNLGYRYDPVAKKVREGTGILNHLKTHTYVTAEDKVFLGHEFIHMNKDTNFEEYRLLLTCIDVIPILYEFIKMGEHEKSILNARFDIITADVECYEFASKQIKASKDKDLYKAAQSKSGQYLNSFYYATVLYRMYQSDPRKILDYIKRVIIGEITTLDMLKELGLYLVDNNAIYDEQLREFKGIIKR